MSLPYACETTGRASAIPLALWSTDLQIELGALDKRPKLSFRPIAGAYVACVQVSDRQSAPIEACDIRYGRTNEVGWVVMRELEALGEPDDVPPQPYRVAPAKPFWFLYPNDPVMFEVADGQCADPNLLACFPNETLRIFWCFDKASFLKFQKELEEDPNTALDAWGARTYKVEPFGEPASLPGLDLLSDEPFESGRPNFTERRVAARLLFAGGRQGYHAGAYFEHYRTAAIFDATPASFRALFLSEWLEWYSAQLRADENWRTLFTALHVSAIAEQGGPVLQFEEQIRQNIKRTLARAGGDAAEPRIFEALADYRKYAHECAKVSARLDSGDERARLRDQYISAIDVRPSARWRENAESLRSKHHVIHPSFTGKHRDADLLLDAEDEQEPLIAYFDYYAEGLRCQADGLTARIREAKSAIDRAFEWIGQKRMRLLQEPSGARHDMLMRDIGLCTPVDLDKRLSLPDRHARQCASLRCAWWVEADRDYLATQGQWDAFVTKLGWLSGVTNGVGDILAGFVGTYASMYQHTPETARAAVRLCLRYERWITAGVTEDIVLPTASAHWSYHASGKTVSFSLALGKRRFHAGEYTLLEEVQTRRAGFTGPTGPVKHVDYRKVREVELAARWKRPPLAALAMDPEAVERLEGRAGVISTLASLLDVAIAARELADAPEMSAWELFTSEPAQAGTWAALEGVESTTQFIQAARKARGLAPLSERALVWAARIGGVGTAFEGAATLVDGYKAVYAEDGDMVAALDRGEQTRATLELTKGVCQLAMGTGGMVAGLAGMAGLSVVAGPFGILFGLGSVAVAVTQAAIYVHTGGSNRVQPLIDQIAAAEHSEFHLDARGHATARENRAVRLRQRIGLLNETLNRAWPSG
jgi:hypothetical protein